LPAVPSLAVGVGGATYCETLLDSDCWQGMFAANSFDANPNAVDKRGQINQMREYALLRITKSRRSMTGSTHSDEFCF